MPIRIAIPNTDSFRMLQNALHIPVQEVVKKITSAFT